MPGKRASVLVFSKNRAASPEGIEGSPATPICTKDSYTMKSLYYTFSSTALSNFRFSPSSPVTRFFPRPAPVNPFRVLRLVPQMIETLPSPRCPAAALTAPCIQCNIAAEFIIYEQYSRNQSRFF